MDTENIAMTEGDAALDKSTLYAGYIVTIVCALFLSMRISMIGNLVAALTVLILPLILVVRRRFTVYIVQLLVVIGLLCWFRVMFNLIFQRIQSGTPFFPLFLLLLVVLVIHAGACMLLSRRGFQAYYREGTDTAWPATLVFVVVCGVLAALQMKLPGLKPVILERFIRGGGWFEIVVIGLYASFLLEQMLAPRGSRKWRLRLWLFFSIVFFSQLLLGLLGIERMLMRGQLHIPVPAVILAGPLYRGEGFFMPILFLTTLLLVGPAWCSYLCYFGAWDGVAAKSRKRPTAAPSVLWTVRWIILAAVILVALIARYAGLSAGWAATLAILFGVAGFAVMYAESRRRGIMVHCISYCPIGLIAVILGRLHPFRIRILESCTDCNACSLVCRYDALSENDIRQRQAGINCTLCGDCISGCPHQSIAYHVYRRHSPRTRTVFIVMIVSLHAIFLALARV